MRDVCCSVELQEELQAFQEADRRRILEIRNVVNDLEAEVNILHTRSRANTWEVISNRVASEIDRMSARLNERMTEVERAVQTQSTSPATLVERNQAIHEDIIRLGSRTRSKIADATTQLKGLREFVLAVEQFIHRKLPLQHGGVSAPDYSPRQGHTDQTASLGPTHATSSLLLLVRQRKRELKPLVQDHGPSERLTPATPTSTTVFSTIQSNAGQELKSVTQINGHLEMH